MQRRGQLQSLRGLMASYDRSWIRWSLTQVTKSAAAAARALGTLISGEDAREIQLDEELVIMDLLKVHTIC